MFSNQTPVPMKANLLAGEPRAWQKPNEALADLTTNG
jgi:hypothetical protein